MKTIKVIHLVLGKANPERMNGVNRVVHQLATAQHRAGIEVSVWGITDSQTHDYPERPFSTQLFPKFNSYYTVGPEMKQAISELPADCVVQMHGGFIPEFYSVGKLLKKRNIPYVVTPHGNYMQGALKKSKLLKHVYFLLRESALLRNAHAIQCLGSGESNDLQKIFRGGKIEVVPNGITLKESDSTIQKNKSTEPLVFGYCGRISKFHKGLDLLLEGFILFKKTYPEIPAVLWMIGEGEYLDEMKLLAKKHNVEEHVIFLGSKFGKEKEDLIASMHAFYHCSRHEGMPLALLEAAAMGVPLVVSEYTNMTEYVKKYHAGVCLQDNDAKDISDSMRIIAGIRLTGALQERGENAARMIREAFQWDKIVAQLQKIYLSS